MDKEVETINSIERALDVITLLYREGCELGVLEIARKLGVYQSTVYRTIATLSKKGFVYQNAQNSKYGLGIKLYSIGMVARQAFSWLHTIEPYINELAVEFEETVNVSMMDESEKEQLYCILVKQKVIKKRRLGSGQVQGESTECYCSAVGKVLMAFSKENIEDRILASRFTQYTKNTITDADLLLKHLKSIRERGFGIDEEEQEEGLYCVACPILDKQGHALAAVSISGLRVRMEAIGVECIVKSLQSKIGEISKLIN